MAVEIFDPKIIFHDATTGRAISVTISDDSLQSLIAAPGSNVIELNLSYEAVDVDLLGQVVFKSRDEAITTVDEVFNYGVCLVPIILKPRYSEEASTGELLSSTFTPKGNRNLSLKNVIWDFSYYPDFKDDGRPLKNPPSITKSGDIGKLAYSAIIPFNVNGKLFVRLTHEFVDNSTGVVQKLTSLPKVIYLYGYVGTGLDDTTPGIPGQPVDPDDPVITVPDEDPNQGVESTPPELRPPLRNVKAPFLFNINNKNDIYIVSKKNVDTNTFYRYYWLNNDGLLNTQITRSNYTSFLNYLRSNTTKAELCLEQFISIDTPTSLRNFRINGDLLFTFRNTTENKDLKLAEYFSNDVRVIGADGNNNYSDNVKYSYITSGYGSVLSGVLYKAASKCCSEVFTTTNYTNMILYKAELTLYITNIDGELYEGTLKINIKP